MTIFDRNIAVSILVVAMFGCPGTPSEPPVEPPPTTTIPEPPPPDPAPPDPPPAPTVCALPDSGRGELECYVTTIRAGIKEDDNFRNATGITRSMMITDMELINTSRNFMGASETCREHLGENVPPFHVKPSRLSTLAHTGHVLHDGGREVGERNTIGHPSMLSFVGEGTGIGRLQRVNRLCTAAPDPWCRRTGVFKPLLENFRADAREHMDLMRSIDGRAGHLGFDGISAWCKAQ